MPFDDDAAAALRLHLEACGETVTYWPHGGLPRPVVALVDRNPPSALAADPQLVLPAIVVTVESHAVRGVLPDQVDTGGDLFELALVKGGEPERRRVTELAVGESGSTVLYVQ